MTTSSDSGAGKRRVIVNEILPLYYAAGIYDYLQLARELQTDASVVRRALLRLGLPVRKSPAAREPKAQRGPSAYDIVGPLHADGMSNRDIAEQTGFAINTIQRAVAKWELHNGRSLETGKLRSFSKKGAIGHEAKVESCEKGHVYSKETVRFNPFTDKLYCLTCARQAALLNYGDALRDRFSA